MEAPDHRPSPDNRATPTQIGIGIGAAIAVILVIILLSSGGDDSTDVAGPVGAPEGVTAPEQPALEVEARIATPGEMSDLARQLGHPVYWAGAQGPALYELTSTADGNVYIRYLDRPSQLGDPLPDYLTIGTYPSPNATKALANAAEEAGEEILKSEDGGDLYFSQDNPTSVYIAYPGADYQIEVYSPEEGRALELATSGEIEPLP